MPFDIIHHVHTTRKPHIAALAVRLCAHHHHDALALISLRCRPALISPDAETDACAGWSLTHIHLYLLLTTLSWPSGI